MEQTVNLNDLLTVLKRFWIWLIAAGVLCAVLVYAFFSLFVTPKYTSSVDFVGNNGFVGENDDYDQTIQYQDYIASVRLVDTYIGILESGTSYLEEAGRAVEPHLPLADMKKYVSFYRNENTTIFRVNATTGDPMLSAELCGALSKTVKGFLEEKMPGSKVSVINERIEPGVLTYPASRYYATVGGISGFALAFLALFFVVYFDNTVKREEDFKQKFEYNFLGEIPNVAPKVKKGADDRVRESRLFQFNETFKSIRISLFYALAAREKNIVVISSALANEGKTTVACNLASAVAQSNARVLLIDADMRCPSVNRFFKVQNKAGLADVLSRQKSFEDAVQKNVVDGIDLLLSGVIPPNPSELLGSKAMAELLDRASSEYDYVLIDTAPVNMVSDALTFIDKTAGMLIVARYKKTTYNDLAKSFDRVKSFDGSVLGVVLNDVERTKKDYKRGSKYYSA